VGGNGAGRDQQQGGPQSKYQTARCLLIKLPRAELKLQLISSVAQSFFPLQNQKQCTTNRTVVQPSLALLFLGSVTLAILGFLMPQWIGSVLLPIDTDLLMTLIR